MTSDDSGTKVRAKALEPLLLWIGMIVPPTAWMIQLFALYMLEDFIACTPGSQTPGAILGFGVRSVAMFITIILALATAAAGALAFSMWRRMGTEEYEGTGTGRPRWMALAGIMSSLLFLAIIVIKVAPPLMLGVCQAPL
jgi:uncharacterized membrane protein YhdT